MSRDEMGVHITLRYEAPTETWWQSFVTVPLDELQIEELLLGAGFANIRWFGAARLWALAVAQ